MRKAREALAGWKWCSEHGLWTMWVTDDQKGLTGGGTARNARSSSLKTRGLYGRCLRDY